MELPEDNRPLLAEFTATTATRIVSPDGSRCMNFEAGETRAVHRDLFAAAIAQHLVPMEPLEYAVPELPENKPQEVTVMEGLVEACTTLIIRGNPNDFTLIGQPRAASVKKLVDFNFTTNDVKRAFEQAMHEVEQNGDDSTEHPESSVSAAE